MPLRSSRRCRFSAFAGSHVRVCPSCLRLPHALQWYTGLRRSSIFSTIPLSRGWVSSANRFNAWASWEPGDVSAPPPLLVQISKTRLVADRCPGARQHLHIVGCSFDRLRRQVFQIIQHLQQALHCEAPLHRRITLRKLRGVHLAWPAARFQGRRAP